MSNLQLCKRRMAVSLCLVGIGIVAMSCSKPSVPVQNLKAEEVTWTSYTDPFLSYSLRYPVVFKCEVYSEGSAFFRYDGEVPVVIRYADKKEGKKRGLWFGEEPVGTIALAGRTGDKYIYKHWDGPFAARTIAYVIPYQEKFLGIEFRTPNELNEIQQQMLDSFKLPKE